jgi:tetratricopeptide (TPR) repeat protein
MSNGYIFISHATINDNFVKELRNALEGLGISVWVDSRNLRYADKLHQKIKDAIQNARAFIVVFSADALNSEWVQREIRIALGTEKQKSDEDYVIIPILMPDVGRNLVNRFLPNERIFIEFKPEQSGMMDVLVKIMVALGEKMPDDPDQIQEIKPTDDLILELKDPEMKLEGGKRLLSATAILKFDPADVQADQIEGKRFKFTAPMGPIEKEDLRWYLEKFSIWPTGIFKERADVIEAKLPKWGNDLYKAVFGTEAVKSVLKAWKHASGTEHRFSVMIDSDLQEGEDEKKQLEAKESASEISSLPWELLHDGDDYLFQSRNAVRVRRRMPNRRERIVGADDPPIRILLVSARPEDDHAGYLDHRASALPLVEATESLGELVSLKVLDVSTLPALKDELKRAVDDKKPYHVVHFDGHGVYDKRLGLGALCFEDPEDSNKLEKRKSKMVSADEFAGIMKDYGIPLVFLDACQSAMTDESPNASVAGRLLEEGVASVVAMGYSVLVETSKRFVKAFYTELSKGSRVGSAMLAGQKALQADSYRGKIMGAGKLNLQDWFVPVLYQEEHDPQMFRILPSEAYRELLKKRRMISFGQLPEPPEHTFVGRSREMLKIERLLLTKQYAVVKGQGGSGKTAIAIELARWLIRSSRFERGCFVCMETYVDTRGLVDSIGKQLLPEGEKWSVTGFDSISEALQPIKRALREHKTIVVIDNMESILPDANGKVPLEAVPVDELFAVCKELLESETTRIVFTSRESLTNPYDDKRHEVILGSLARDEAIELVSKVMEREGWTPKEDDPGKTPQEIIDLVESANCHARALVLIAREVGRQGVTATTENFIKIMAELHKKNPDDRENSLYASVELSLRRLPTDVREQIKALGVFHGGFHVGILAMMLDITQEESQKMAVALIEVGLGQYMVYDHIHLDPALPSYLLMDMSEDEQESLRAKWAEGMRALTNFLYQQQFKDAQISANLTILEMPNLLAMLGYVQDKYTPEDVVNLAQGVERLIANLGKAQALAYAVEVRERSAEKLGVWSRVSFNAESAKIDRLLESGDVRSAYESAERLLKRCLAESENAYAGADYDIAMAHFSFGRVLKMIGSVEGAIPLLEEAERRFQALADAGNTGAEGMASTSISERAECLTRLGRLDESAEAYNEAIEIDEKLGDKRGVAVDKGNLGTVRGLQKRYDEAHGAYNEAIDIFESLGEPTTVAIFWHQKGNRYKEAGQYEQAEEAYRKSLGIKVRQGDHAGEALTLSELGNLYDAMGRLEEAVRFYRQAADIDMKLNDLFNEGIDHSNIAGTLIKLGRYDEARLEVLRAIECRKPYGHSAFIWTTWNILRQVEQALGNRQGAEDAKQQAIESYRAYRIAGGYNQAVMAEYCSAVAQAIQQNNVNEAKQAFLPFLKIDNVPSDNKVMFSKLIEVLDGSRDMSLADDPELNIWDVVELQLLLESIK